MPDREAEIVESESSGGMLWFLAGMAIGTAVAMLYAPKSGKDTRDLLGQKTQETAERTREFYTQGMQLVDDAARLWERGRKLVRG